MKGLGKIKTHKKMIEKEEGGYYVCSICIPIKSILHFGEPMIFTSLDSVISNGHTDGQKLIFL